MIAPSQDLRGFLESVYLRQRPDFAPGSAAQIRSALNLYSRWLGHPVRFDDLSRDSMLAWMQWLRPGRSAATVNSKRRAILAIWREAAEQGFCDWPPRIPKLREPRRIPVAWTLPELERIFAACNRLTGSWEGVPVSLCWRIALLILWDTGGRLGLLLKAKTPHVDLNGRSLFVPAEHIKGKREDRIFRLHPQTLATIRESLPSDREMLFPYPYSQHRIWRYLKRILRSAGLPCDRTRMFHCIRRTAESYAAAARGIPWAAAALGHSVEVAQTSYISPLIYEPPSLIEALPRPRIPTSG